MGAWFMNKAFIALLPLLLGATQVGTGTATVTSGMGALNTQNGAVGNVGTGEDDLHSYAMPANTLVTTGRCIWWNAAGTTASNINTKTMKVYFGAQILSVTLPVSAVSNWFGEATICRT